MNIGPRILWTAPPLLVGALMRVALRTLIACTSYRTARRAGAHGPHGL